MELDIESLYKKLNIQVREVSDYPQYYDIYQPFKKCGITTSSPITLSNSVITALKKE